MFKRIAALLCALIVVGGLSLAGTGPALADRSDCPSGAFCAWYLSSYDGARYTDYDNGTWTNPVRNDDMSWYNHGTPCYGCDHIRVYDAADSPDSLTLCIHRGASGHVFGERDDHADMLNAANRGNYHRWGGECRARQPQLD